MKNLNKSEQASIRGGHWKVEWKGIGYVGVPVISDKRYESSKANSQTSCIL